MAGDAEAEAQSFSSLRARFEQLASPSLGTTAAAGPAAPRPKLAPKPSGLVRSPASSKPPDTPAAGSAKSPLSLPEAGREGKASISPAASGSPGGFAKIPSARSMQPVDAPSDSREDHKSSPPSVDALPSSETSPLSPFEDHADEPAESPVDIFAAAPVVTITDDGSEPDARPLKPTSPPLDRQATLRRPPPPRPAHSRLASGVASPPSFASLLPQIQTDDASLKAPSPSTSNPATPSPTSSVRNLVSQFNSTPEPADLRSHSAPTTTFSTPSMRDLSSNPLDDAVSLPVSPFEAGREPVEAEVEAPFDDPYSSDSTYSSSTDEESADEKSSPPEVKPAIPPRPVLPEHPIAMTPPVKRGSVPPLPSRPVTQPTSPQSASFPERRGSAPVAAPALSRSPAASLSLASDRPSSPAIAAPLLPPSRTEHAASLSVPSAAPPALPARVAGGPPVPLPPRPAKSASTGADPVAPTPTPAPTTATPAPGTAYVPPPPRRTPAATAKIAPIRPAVTASGVDGSSEGEDEETSKVQEYPDATFANRRPPTHRYRRPVHATNQFSAWTVRGSRVVTAHHRLHLWHSSSNGVTSSPLPVGHDQQKFMSLEWRGADSDRPEDEGRYLWCGTKEGHLYEVDLEQQAVTESRPSAHAYPVTAIYRYRRSMVTVDESGKVMVWAEKDGRAASLSAATPLQQRLPLQQTWTAMIGDELWTSSGPTTKAGSTAVSMRSPQIRVFDPTGARGGAFSLLSRPLVTPEYAGYVGAVTCHAIVPEQDHLVYLGHDNGYMSVWDRAAYQCTHVQRVAAGSVSSLVGVRRFLWAGFRTGNICVYDVSAEPWTVVKTWKAHADPVIGLMVDTASLWQDATLQVASASNETVCLWDGFLREDWIDAELHLRQPDYCTFRSVRALSVTWNVDSHRPTDLQGPVDNLEFLRNVLTSVDSPDIISFGFQEMIDLEDKKLTAKSMLMGKKKNLDGKMSDSLSTAYRQWHDKLVQAVRLNLPADTPYTVVHVGDMIGLFSCIFVKSSEAARLRDVALVDVKTGMGGRYGNKGAILARFVIDDSSFCFINCHLAAGQSHRRERDRDLADILETKASFSELGSSSPGAYAPGGAGTMVFDHELTILSGDLNYRIDARRDTVVSAVASGNSESLLQHDQLLKNLATNQSFRLRSFKESAIRFPPTYKYDPGTDQYDSSPKRRIPAWCDRILWRADRSEHVTPLHYQRYEVNISDHKPVSAAFDCRVKRIDSTKRAAVWQEVESAWFSVESSILDSARQYYREKE